MHKECYLYRQWSGVVDIAVNKLQNNYVFISHD